MDIQASEDLLISQWRVAPKISTMVRETIRILQEDVGDSFTELEKMWDVDTATGVWLDFIALRIGIERPLVANPGIDNRFGFEGPTQSQRFDNAPFSGSLNNIRRYPLSDIQFRKMIKCRGLLDTSNGDFPTFERAVKIIDFDADAIDNRDMTITIYTDNRVDFDIAERIGALPRNAAVKVNYLPGRHLGFDDAGDTFDQAPLR